MCPTDKQSSLGRSAKQFYRFHRPTDNSFPARIELFARRPETLRLARGGRLSPIPVEEDLIRLSAILLDDTYFEALQKARCVIDNVSLIDERILIPFKARAFLDLSGRNTHGASVDARHIRKHRADVFRLVQLLPGEGSFALAAPIRSDLAEFVKQSLSDPGFDYAALMVQLPLEDATAILSRYYQLDISG